jgi:hypothetical protein
LVKLFDGGGELGVDAQGEWGGGKAPNGCGRFGQIATCQERRDENQTPDEGREVPGVEMPPSGVYQMVNGSPVVASGDIQSGSRFNRK